MADARSVVPSRLRGRIPHRRAARAVTVGIAAVAVVAGSATGVLAAPYSPPDAEVAVSESLQPILHGTATAPGSGSESLQFFARTMGASAWDLLDGVSVSGTDAYQALPAGALEIGEAFEYQIAHCDSSGCNPSAVQTGYVSPALGAGLRPGATRLPFTLGDRLGGQVDVGSGNLLATVSLFSLPRRSGSPLEVGLAYNSVTRRAEAQFDGSVGHSSSGWRLSTGSDVRLVPVAGHGAVVYSGPNGLTGTFLPKSGGGFTSPAGFKMTLTAVSGGWTLNDHGSGDTRHFDASGWMTELTDRDGNTSSFSYDASGALTSITSDVGGTGARTLTVSTEGAGRGRITEISQTADGYGGATRSVALAYDATTGYLSQMTDVLGRTTTFVHGQSGNLNRIVAPGGIETAFGYDEHGRVQTVTQPTADPAAQAVTRLKYFPGETVVADPNSDQSLPADYTTHTSYQLTGDGWKLVAKTVDPAGKERSATYTPFLDVASSTDAAGTSTFGYDPAVNGGESLTSTTSATGAGSLFAYGNTAQATRFRPTGGTDAQGNASTFTYNGAGNLQATENAGSAEASVTYSTDGTVATSTSPSNAVTSYGYDGVGQLTSITPPAGGSLGGRSYTYDGFGRVATYTSGRGITVTYSYDLLDRITAVDYSDTTPTVSYGYNSAGRIDTRTDASGTTSYGYDPLGRLTARDHSAATTGQVTYTYDKMGNLATATNAAGTTTYKYDVRNLVTDVIPSDGRLIRFSHDASGRRTDTWFHVLNSGASWAAHTHVDYDASGRITGTWTSTSSPWSSTSTDADRVYDVSYSYADDPDGGLCATARAGYPDSGLRWVERNNLTGVYTNYCYDAANRLTLADPGNVGPTTYAYDANSNRTSVVTNGSTQHSLAFNAVDQITTTGYGYDASGNTTTAPAVGTATYNGAEQMTARTAGGSTYSYTYAGTDQVELIAQTGRAYTYGRTNSAGLPIIEDYTSGTSTYSYVYDPQGAPLVLDTGATSHFLAVDGLGSIVALVNHDGATTGTYSYDPWGKATATAVGGSSINLYQLYGYAGGFDDPRSTLVHYGQRWYDPATGRFTQQDRLETLADPTRANRYEYAASNPINYIDPTGLAPTFWQKAGAKVAGAIAGLAGAVVGATVGTAILPGPGTVGGAYVGGACASQVVEDGVLANVNGQAFGGTEALQSCALGLIS